MHECPATRQPSPALLLLLTSWMPQPQRPRHPAGAAGNGATPETRQLPPRTGAVANHPAQGQPPCDLGWPLPHWKHPPPDRHSCPRHCPARRGKPVRGHAHPRLSPDHAPASTSQDLNPSQTPKSTLSPLSPTKADLFSLLFASPDPSPTVTLLPRPQAASPTPAQL